MKLSWLAQIVNQMGKNTKSEEKEELQQQTVLLLLILFTLLLQWSPGRYDWKIFMPYNKVTVVNLIY